MNEKDREIIIKLKISLSEVITDSFTDYDFLRWIQGHNYDFDVIVPKLRHHFRLLHSYNLDKFNFQHEVVSNYWPYGFLGLEGHGHYFPYIETQGTLDAEGVLKCVPKMQIVMQHFYKIEKVVLKSMRKHESVTGVQSGIIWIQDGEGLHVTPKLLALIAGPYKLLIDILLKHYAEMLKKFIFINAPTSIWMMYNLIKPILPEKTRQKFIVLGSNWKTEIVQYCDPDALPVHYGGTVVDEDGDPKCRSKVVFTSKVPEKFYWTRSEDDPMMNDLTVLTVNAGKFVYVTVEIKDNNNILEWCYYADSDWGFGVFFTENENETVPENMEMVYPQIDRLGGPVIVPERDSIECKKIGFYKIWFNNYFSWFTKLQIKYKINITYNE